MISRSRSPAWEKASVAILYCCVMGAFADWNAQLVRPRPRMLTPGNHMQTIPPNSNRSGEISGFLSNKRWSKFGGHLNREIQDERERGAGATSITDNGQRRRVPDDRPVGISCCRGHNLLDQILANIPRSSLTLFTQPHAKPHRPSLSFPHSPSAVGIFSLSALTSQRPRPSVVHPSRGIYSFVHSGHKGRR